VFNKFILVIIYEYNKMFPISLKFIGLREILVLAFLFTILAVYFNIHGEKHVLIFVINHVIALLLALVISKVIYNIIKMHGH
jgi:hypothetical protein